MTILHEYRNYGVIGFRKWVEEMSKKFLLP